MVDTIRIEGVVLPAEGHGVRVTADGKPVAIFRHQGKLFAVSAICSHVGGPLDRGKVTGDAVECPLHGSQFSLETGAVVRGPAQRAVPAYRVTTEGTAVLLDRVE